MLHFKDLPLGVAITVFFIQVGAKEGYRHPSHCIQAPIITLYTGTHHHTVYKHPSPHYAPITTLYRHPSPHYIHPSPHCIQTPITTLYTDSHHHTVYRHPSPHCVQAPITTLYAPITTLYRHPSLYTHHHAVYRHPSPHYIQTPITTLYTLCLLYTSDAADES